MPTKVVQANTTAVIAFTTPMNKLAKIEFLQIDNQHTAPITITISDVFVPTPSAGNPSPTQVSVVRKVITIAAGSIYAEEVNIDIIGTCAVVASATSPVCNITIGYDFV